MDNSVKSIKQILVVTASFFASSSIANATVLSSDLSVQSSENILTKDENEITEEYATELVENYVIHIGARSYFAVSKAISAGESKDVIAFGNAYNYMLGTNDPNETSMRAQPAAALNHGRWCGANNTQADESIPGVDPMDEACKQHDICLKRAPRERTPMQACDQALLDRLRSREVDSTTHGGDEIQRIAFIAAIEAAKQSRPVIQG